MAKEKFYVVWHGVEPGIYTNWKDCEKQVKGFDKALYKSFGTKQEAEEAFSSSPYDYIGSNAAAQPSKQKSLSDVPAYRSDTVLPLPLEVTSNAIAVDAACSGNPGAMEYRGVDLKTGAQIFHYGPVFGTNNIGEFLAIVHGLALLKQKGITNLSIYSDSRNAMSWVAQKKCKTKLELNPKTEELFDLIHRAETWLKNNQYTTPIIKWETEKWGEIPADFGRK